MPPTPRDETVTKRLIPVKAHFFCFFAAMGPILPQMIVFGRQLGISPPVMGTVLAIMPLIWAAGKPTFGLIVDYFRNQRKLIFMLLLFATSASYCCLYFLPKAPFVQTNFQYLDEHMPILVDFKLSNRIIIKSAESVSNTNKTDKGSYYNSSAFEAAKCNWICNEIIVQNGQDNDASQYKILFLRQDNMTKSNFSYLNVIYAHEDILPTCSDLSLDDNFEFDIGNHERSCSYSGNCTLSCVFSADDETDSGSAYYLSGIFWAFVIMITVGTVGFNVVGCISDAICFDVLGPHLSTKYGWQRAWGTLGYGLTALVSGFAIDYFSTDPNYKNFTPMFITILIFTIADLACCTKLQLPRMETPENIKEALGTLLKQPRILIFLLFAVFAGTFDSFIVYYMFWFVEELATETGHLDNVKLLEGITVAAESFGGDFVFFIISGKILRYFGYGHSLTFSLASYGLRMLLVSCITNPWHIIGIELLMQGPSYALTYSTIVGYAANVSPDGLSATLQGIVAGMDDGVGFVFGSLIGGLLYGSVGGRTTFRLFAAFAFFTAAAHAVLQATILKDANRHRPPPLENSGTPTETTKLKDVSVETVIHQTEAASEKSAMLKKSQTHNITNL